MPLDKEIYLHRLAFFVSFFVSEIILSDYFISMFSSPQVAYQNVEMQTMLPFSPIPRTIPVENQYNEACDDKRGLGPPPGQQQSDRGRSHSNDESLVRQSARWEPGHWRQFPLLSMLSLLAVLVCTQFSYTYLHLP